MILPIDLKKIEADCLELKEQGNLTEYGEGELRIIEILRSLEPANDLRNSELKKWARIIRSKNRIT